MQVKQGKAHKYIGMTLDYSTVGQVKITILDYTNEILNAFYKVDPLGGGTKSSAATAIHFKVNKDCKKLNTKRAVEFHHLAIKILFATKWDRLYTFTKISFLTPRVRETDSDDWAKLVHIMTYIRGTRNLPLILSANGSGILKWCINGSFAVHPNMRGHTGGGLLRGRGFPIFSSTKKNLNTQSSTETEIVSVDHCVPAILWTRYWLEAQE